MHCEELVISLGHNQGCAGREQFDPNQNRKQAAQKEK
jgi:hypothetical protein